jgi:hypothetical protein
MAWIVKNIFTFVKSFFSMKRDEEIKQMLGRQVKKFLEHHVEGYYKDGKPRSTLIARHMNKFYDGEKIDKNNVLFWLRSPSPGFIYFLEVTCGLSIDWLYHGEEDPSIKPIKPRIHK